MHRTGGAGLARLGWLGWLTKFRMQRAGRFRALRPRPVAVGVRSFIPAGPGHAVTHARLAPYGVMGHRSHLLAHHGTSAASLPLPVSPLPVPPAGGCKHRATGRRTSAQDAEYLKLSQWDRTSWRSWPVGLLAGTRGMLRKGFWAGNHVEVNPTGPIDSRSCGGLPPDTARYPACRAGASPPG